MWLAAKNGHSSVVKLLLERNDVDPDTNVDGDTPLTVAVDNGHEEVVRLLLGKDNVDPNREKRGETPLFRAAATGTVQLWNYYCSETVSIRTNQAI